MVVQQKYISAEDFWELIQQPEYADRLAELVEGEIIEVSQPGWKHGEITMEIARLVSNWAREHKLGRVTAAETGYILVRNPDGRDTLRGIDVGFIRADRIPDLLPDGPVPFAPDLAVEVVSPGNTAADIHNKVLELLSAGTRLIWVVYPDSQTVVVHTAQGAVTRATSEYIEGGEVLPGFQLPVRAIFPA